MSRLFARALKGQRAIGYVSAKEWQGLTLIGGLTCRGVQTLMTLDSPLDTRSFLVFLEWSLLPTLTPGTVVVLDNLSPHRSPRVKEFIEGVGCTVLYLPPYSPDYNPIEMLWSKLKHFLRSLEARTTELLHDALLIALASITPSDALGWFKHCGLS